MSQYLMIAVGVLVLALGTVIWIDTGRIKALNADVTAANVARDSALSANQADIATVDAMQKDLADWKVLAQTRSQAAQEAVQQAQEAQTSRDAALVRIGALQGRDEALPDCAKLLSTRMSMICPDVWAALQEQAK